MSFWPFKRKPKNEPFKDRPPAPCGNDAVHYEWRDIGWECPRCHAIHTNRTEQDKLNQFAKLVADEVVKRLQQHGQ